MKKSIPPHTQILIGVVAGLFAGFIFLYSGISPKIVTHYIKPFGVIFIRGLKMIAMPLVLASLIVGIANLNDISKLSRIGGKTILTYLCTTVIAVSIGLILVNLIKPGQQLSFETRENLMSQFESEVVKKEGIARQLKDAGPLMPLVDIVPENIFQSTTDNSSMLQVVFFAVIFGLALLKVKDPKIKNVTHFFEGLNQVVLKLVDFVMMLAPYGVFAIFASMIVEIAGDNPNQAIDLLSALLWYSLTVILGLIIMMMIIYPTAFKIFTKVSYLSFFKGIRDAQILSFSTSSSSATLPVTMECAEKNLGISKRISSFVLPLGATINMDGTSLYQAVAAVFIAQALNLDLSFSQQLMIVLTATLASIGAAGVPGAGIVMLVIVLESIGVPATGIALILAPDRLLDMCRTTVNVTGDASVSLIVASTEKGELLNKK